jgi:hypothetical protein
VRISTGALGAVVGASLIVGIAAPARAAAAAAGTVARFALVVGSNQPPRPGLATLRYADDDAVRWTVLFRTFGVKVELLTDLDPESDRLYGADVPPHRSPTRVELQHAMTRIRAAIDGLRAAGARTAFYFVYAGHGDEQDGEGYIGLRDGRLFRHEVEADILSVSGADTNHVIIDACRSYYLAYDRGPGGSRRQWLEPYFQTATASRLRNTGFILANSSAGDTHEWEEFQAGIFSHEVRSGLLGGADTNGDGRITYAELTAFVRVANQAVRNARYRPEILARAPPNGDDVILDVGEAIGGVVRFSPGIVGRHVLEDGVGVRWADVHPGPRQQLTLALPIGRWGGDALFIESLANNTEYRVRAGDDTDLATITAEPRGLLRRGAMHEAFALLFTLPFDVTALTAPIDADRPTLELGGPPPIERKFWTRRTKRVMASVAVIGGVAAFATAGALQLDAAHLRSQAQNDSGSLRATANDEIALRNRWTVVAAGGGAVLAAAATALLVWSRQPE